MRLKLSVAYPFLPKTLTTQAAVVMDHFGIGFETGQHVIAERLEFDVQPGEVVCFTGASGSGKSSLMRAAAETLARTSPAESVTDPSARPAVVWCEHLELGTQLLVDGVGLPAAEALSLLAACGLGEAQLLLRLPAELSDGQRYRYRLAKALALKPHWLVADEFTAALDRPLAKVIAFNLRQVARRLGVGCLLATTHEDILADLQPDVHVRCRLDGRITVMRCAEQAPDATPSAAAVVTAKKKSSASPTNCGCPQAPVPTGRTSLGGITAAITSGSSGM